MKQDRIESNARQSGGRTAGRSSEPAAISPGSIERRENLLDALRECYGIAGGEAEHRIREFDARNERPTEPESNPVAALLRRPLR